MNRLNMVWGLLCLLAVGCQSIQPKAPALSSSSLHFEDKESSLNLPFRINLQTVQRTVNPLLPSPLFKLSKYNMGNGIVADVQVTRLSELELTTAGGRINASLPLQVNAKVSLADNPLGLNAAQDFSARLTVKTSTKVGVDPNWQLQTQTEADIRIDNPMKLQALGYTLDFGPMVQDQIKKLLIPKINALIDEQTSKAYDLKGQAKKWYADFTEPIKITDSPAPVWAVLNPTSLSIAPAVSLDSRNLQLGLGMKANVRTAMGLKPEKTAPAGLPALKTTAAQPAQFTLNLPIMIQVDALKEMARKQMVGQSFDMSKKRKVKITGMDLWGQGSQVVVKLDFTSKKTQGILYLIGTPVYDAQTNMLEVKELDMTADTNNAIANKAAWLADKLFIGKLEQQLRYDAGKELDSAKQQLQQQLSNMKLDGGLTLKGKIDQLKIEKVALDNHLILVNSVVSGSLQAGM